MEGIARSQFHITEKYNLDFTESLIFYFAGFIVTDFLLWIFLYCDFLKILVQILCFFGMVFSFPIIIFSLYSIINPDWYENKYEEKFGIKIIFVNIVLFPIFFLILFFNESISLLLDIFGNSMIGTSIIIAIGSGICIGEFLLIRLASLIRLLLYPLEVKLGRILTKVEIRMMRGHNRRKQIRSENKLAMEQYQIKKMMIVKALEEDALRKAQAQTKKKNKIRDKAVQHQAMIKRKIFISDQAEKNRVNLSYYHPTGPVPRDSISEKINKSNRAKKMRILAKHNIPYSPKYDDISLNRLRHNLDYLNDKVGEKLIEYVHLLKKKKKEIQSELAKS